MMIRDIAKFAGLFFPTSLLVKRVKPNVIVPFYHLISDQNPIHLKHLYPIVTTKQFNSHLDYLLRHFTPIGSIDIRKVLNGEISTPKPALHLTFDDGFKELSSTVAPILLARGIPATFFVSPGFVGNIDMLYRCKQSLIVDHILSKGKAIRTTFLTKLEWDNAGSSPHKFCRKFLENSDISNEYLERVAADLGVDFQVYLQSKTPYLNLDEIKNLAQKGFTIGAHSVTHPQFNSISLEEQISQVEISLQWVQDNVPGQPRYFAFPFTDYGVSKDFYNYFLVKNQNVCDLMFGTAGYKPTNSNRMIHRIPMEIEGKNALQILKGEFFYYLVKSLMGKQNAILPV
jgi:peptidoglycan/xylan/chitin deacetylase (PgdA/CDA1 family)